MHLGTGEIILIVVVILVLFGAKKIPDLARGLGKGISEFKKGLSEVDEDSGRSDGTKGKEDKNSENK